MTITGPPTITGGGSTMEQSTAYPFPGSGPSRYFDQVTLPQYLERALILVNGMEYFEWESAEVHAEIGGKPPITFRLSVSEQEPWPEDWAFLRLRPDDKCTFYLNGYQACRGKVITRQVFYDANQHAVEIQGWDQTGILNYMTADTETGEFRKKAGMEILQKIAGSIPVISSGGNPSKTPIDRFQITPGQSKSEAMEAVMRQMGALQGPDPDGKFDVLGSEFGGRGFGEVIEGRDILIGREIIQSTEKPWNMAGTQAPGSDDQSMAQAAHGMTAQGQNGGGDMMTSMFQRVLAEIPAQSIDQLKQRARIEDNVGDQNSITVTVTLLGWERSSGGGLWWPGDIVWIDAPMLIMQRPLILKAVTFTQDNSTGTRATLECVNITAMGGGKAGPGSSDSGNGNA